MSDTTLQLISDLSGIAVLGLFIIAFIPLIKVLAKFIEKKLNGGIPLDIYKKFDDLEENHIHEINNTLKEIKDIVSRTDEKIGRVCEGIEVIKERTKKL